MSQGNDFANYSAASASGSTGAEDVWFVAVASDDIKQMNVDQLDEAFRLGVITAETAVWTEGMEAWAPLGQVADLDGSSDDGGSAEAGHGSAAGSTVPAREASATVPALGSANLASTMQSGQHSFAPGPSSISPVTASYAPPANHGGPVAPSLDDDVPALPQGRGFKPARWALGAAALVAVGVIAYNNMFSSSVASAGTQATAATAAAAAPVASRAYDSADGVEPGEKLTAQASATVGDTPAPAKVPEKAADEPSSPAASAPAKASAADDEDAPSSAKGKADKESLKGNVSRAFNGKKASSKSKVKPRKSRSTKSRSTKSAKKPGVTRSQSAFDPLNDSLP